MVKPELTPRQIEVAELAAQGLSNSEIASRLKIKSQSVRQYMYKMYKALEIPGDAQAKRMKVLLMIQRGEI